MVAMGAGLLVVAGVRSLLPLVSYPPARIAALVVDAVPGNFATFMIESLGTWALRGLGIGVNVVTVVAGGLMGILVNRGAGSANRARRALAIGAVMFAGAAALSAGDVGGLTLVGVVSYVVASLVFAKACLDSPLLAAIEPGDMAQGETPLDAILRSRRRFVVRGLWIFGLLAGGGVLRAFLARRSAPQVQIVAAHQPFRAPPADSGFPAVPGHTPEITPIEEFYNIDINLVKPAVDHVGWELGIHGLVDRPYTLDYRQMQTEFEVVEMVSTLTCISNQVGGNLISTAVWRGVRLREVLERAGVQEGVLDIVFTGAEGYTDSIRLTEALKDDTLLVFGMNGRALPRVHGFPARIIVPNIYGMKNVKWLTGIEAVDVDYQGYWMVRGWSDEAVVRTQSRFDLPGDGARVGPGDRMAGVAWAGDRGIRRVEISTDGGGTWVPALLKRELSPRTWRLWASELNAGAGRAQVLVRAVDGRGEVQTAQVSRPHPAGATGHHRRDLTVQ